MDQAVTVGMIVWPVLGIGAALLVGAIFIVVLWVIAQGFNH